jgi:predicted cupin superfamily sugar epimerase
MLMEADYSVSDLIRILDLKPHPEGGYYRETFRDAAGNQGRTASTAIYFLLPAGDESRWHRIDSVEVWHWYGGAPLLLSAFVDGHELVHVRLGMDLAAGERPQAFVPGGAWQSAKSLGAWTLVGCTVAPGFLFEKFEVASRDWAPPNPHVTS